MELFHLKCGAVFSRVTRDQRDMFNNFLSTFCGIGRLNLKAVNKWIDVIMKQPVTSV